jgi:hypothetical protein
MVRGRHATRAAGVALALALVLPHPAAAAADAPFSIEDVVSLATADLDGDGSREIVVLVTGNAGLEARALVFDAGEWRVRASGPVEMRDSASGERRPVRLGADGAALLEWQQDGRAGVLLVTTQHPVGAERPCCVEIAPLRLDGGRLVAGPGSDEIQAADTVMTVDFEDDGTQELFLTSQDFTNGQTQDVAVLAWDGSSLRQVKVDGLLEVATDIFAAPGDADGEPGEELVFPPAGDDGRYARLRTDGAGGLVVEVAPPLDDEEPMWFAGSARGLLVGQTPRDAVVLRWPRDGALTPVRALEGITVGGFLPWVGSDLPAVVGYGSTPSVFGGSTPSVVVDVEGEVIAELEPSPAVERLLRYLDRDFRAFANAGHPMYPFAGALLGGLPGGSQVFVGGGNAVYFHADGTTEVRPASAMLDVAVLGTAGPDSGWAAVTEGAGWLAYGRFLWLGVGPPEGSTVRVVPTETLLAPELDDGLLRPTITGAVELPADPDGRARLATGAEGFSVSIDGPPGSRVLAVRDQSIVRQGVLMSDRPLSVNIVPRSERVDRLEAAFLLITPTGQAFGVDWAVDVLREPPGVTAGGATRDGAWSAVVTGEATPGSLVRVDGVATEVADDGAFSVTVDAGLWPRPVSVTASDALGRETTTRVDVVGMVDYRSWPWIPILGALTVVFGAVLFVRTPGGRRHQPADALADEGMLEEIDAG